MYKIKQLFYKDKHRLFFILLKNLKSERRDLVNYIGENYYKSDNTIYEYLDKHFEFSESNGSLNLNCLQNSNIQDKIDILNNLDNLKYLDIGCHKGILTKSIANYFKIKENNIYGIDVKKHDLFMYNFKLIEYSGEILFNDNQFNIVTCFMVIHHCNNYEKLISEIYRILKPGGILIIKEHDCVYYDDKLVLDILHDFYDKVLYQDSNNWYSDYKSENNLTNYIKNLGFELVCPIIIKNKKINPLRNYISIFTKNL